LSPPERLLLCRLWYDNNVEQAERICFHFSPDDHTRRIRSHSSSILSKF
jgi:hypothetical protein